MIVNLSLYGAFREFEPSSRVTLELPEGAGVGELRTALGAYASSHWSGFRPGLLASSAFASQREVLRDGDKLPDDGEVAILPPVSGG